MGPVLGTSLGPHDNIGGGLRVGDMTVVPHAGCISGTDWRHWVQPSIR